ncbi:peptide deformylase [Streptomyces sp. NBC_00124]|uniref:peptide deformylase n=1 Tax=Streptomyces sp. NBC_00124 TaxID=2975662 RepID=UPI002B1DCE69|nr:peptide deformylase [Streptomyces sp. NBC_00124]
MPVVLRHPRQGPRPRIWRVQHEYLSGKSRTTTHTDGLARLVEYEIDHLDGVLYVARMTPGTSTISVAEYDGTEKDWQHSLRSGA